MARSRKVAVPIALLKLSTEQFAWYIENLPPDKNKTELTMNNSIGFGVEPSKNVIGCIFKFELLNSDDLPVLIVEVNVHFAVEPEVFGKLLNKKKRQFKLPFESACHILSITIGSARGILHTKTEGTVVNGLHIPLLNTEAFISEDIIIDFQNKVE
jgi:hypothetical protein